MLSREAALPVSWWEGVWEEGWGAGAGCTVEVLNDIIRIFSWLTGATKVGKHLLSKKIEGPAPLKKRSAPGCFIECAAGQRSETSDQSAYYSRYQNDQQGRFAQGEQPGHFGG